MKGWINKLIAGVITKRISVIKAVMRDHHDRMYRLSLRVEAYRLAKKHYGHDIKPSDPKVNSIMDWLKEDM
tara:strand:+ start:560 stop:772 length:213 start_codon:yes stop_codon:yes gene_type:complete